MAQVDTGLGWSMDDAYAAVSAGKIGEYRTIVPQSPITGQPIPRVAGESELSQNGYVFNIPISSFSFKAGNLTALPVYVFYYSPGTNQHRFVFVSAVSGVTVVSAQVYNTGRVTGYTEMTIGQLDNTSGLYYYQLSGSGAASPQCPQFASFADGMSYFSAISTDIYKLNSGYAVACFAKWRDFAPSTYWTPFLISTDENAIILSTDGTTEYPYATKAIQRYDGMTFYVSYIRGVDGDPSTTYPTFDANAEFIGPSGDMLSLNNVFALIASSEHANILVNETADPYEDFGNTGEDAGETDSNPDDDDIEEDNLPTLSFASAGFCRIYSPSLVQLDSLSNYLWTDQTFLQTVINHLKQIIENPIDAIISLSLVPCVPPKSAAEEVKVMFIPTGVYMPPVTNQFVEVDCGTFTLKEMYGSALDYNPYTSVQLYLPYVGIVQLDTDEVMGKTIQVGYRIDVVTGVCCAYVKAGRDVLYQFSGHCSIQQPITSADFSGYINAALAAGKLVASIAAAGAGAPEVAASLVGAPAPSVTSTSSDTRTTERNTATGRQITAGTQHSETKTERSGASFGEVAARGISNTVGAVMNSKTIVQHSGGFSGNSGYLAAVRRPYLIVTRPRIANPEQYGQFNGRPSMIYLNLGSCTGYTQVQSIHLTGIDATNPELSEIATLLTSGVIF